MKTVEELFKENYGIYKMVRIENPAIDLPEDEKINYIVRAIRDITNIFSNNEDHIQYIIINSKALIDFKKNAIIAEWIFKKDIAESVTDILKHGKYATALGIDFYTDAFFNPDIKFIPKNHYAFSFLSEKL